MNYKVSETPATKKELQGVVIPKPGFIQSKGKPVLASNDKFYIEKDGQFFEASYEIVKEGDKK